ncbi:GPI ethanolamine phosphate transferase 2-like [Macrobrachium nipponense]|uniref:GPI ethanolamine phosphate transferase 2-like n=1 Tax=Macrobrachium nipponense TaxID=159736 RepID=UPI0030C8A4E9
MRLTGLSHLLVEQLAIIAALLAYLTGIVSVRPHPIPPEDPFATQEQGRNHGTADKPIEKVVLVIIDALRTDHLALTNQPLMPHMYDLLTRGKAYGFVLHTATPTVTLPRIKSLVTGSIPGFMDIITNFGAGELVDDNLIQRWVDAGKRIHFYGDNTWLSLFPKQFTKYDAVTSFFVSDYTEVDRNVTRHIPNEMKSDDWDVLILHYLGLDHIGHLEGPMSSLIGPKLLEMDRVLHDIQQGLQKKEKPYLVLVCGDHGMSDAGGHGGSSHSEVTTSAMLFSNTFGKVMGGKPREVKQVDVASTLAFLTNVEVPEGNVGRPITEVVSHLDIKKRMLLHHNAAKQLLSVARGSGLSVNHDNADLLFEEATKLHKEVLEKLNKDPPDEDYKESEAKRVLKFYQECEQMASDALTSKLQSYDLPTIFSSTIIVIMVLTVSVWRMCTGVLFTDNISGISIICCAGCTLLLWLLSCAATTNSHICHLLRPTPWLLTVSIIYIMVMVSQVFHARLPEPNQEQLVPSSSGVGTPPSTDSQPQTITASANANCVRFLRNSESPNFMDFMKFAAQRDADIDPQNIMFLESDKRESTLRQYDSAVKKLAVFLRDSNAQTMTTNLTISFFRSLFEKGLAASTITTAKSAFKKIFQFGFKIDLTDSYFTSIPKACARLRPTERLKSVSWFLNDVLELASDTNSSSCDYLSLLRKTLFLISLASGARISELSALSRDPGHVEFLPSGEVLLSPDRQFLAKIEDPIDSSSCYNVISYFFFQRNGGLESVSYFLLIGTGFHIISLLGTSLVEEEHQTLYFLTTSLHFSLIVKLLIQGMKPLQMYHSKAQGKERLPYEADVDTSEGELPTSVGKKGKRESVLQKLRKSPHKIVVLLIISVTLSRLMRSWNSTGDKWKHLEDLGDGIRASGSSMLALVVLSGLVVAIFLFSETCLPLVLVTCGCIFGRHFQWSGKSSEFGVLEAQISYLVLFILFVYGLLRAGLITCKAHDSKLQKLPDVYDPEEEKISIVLKYTYATVCLLCLLLQRADNVGLISLVFLQNHIVSAVLCKLVTHCIISKKMAALAINWLAFAHFFYQGNSNSLTTIDISAGFVGVTSYHPVLHGILIATQTFGGSFLTYLSYLTHIISKDGQKERWQQPLYVWWAVRLATISLYLINVTFQRHHLFIWSVFTPKLLYEGAHLLVLCILTFFMWGVEKICTILEVSYRFE